MTATTASPEIDRRELPEGCHCDFLNVMAAKHGMTEEHKAALAEGRRQGKAVRDYLEALEQHKPKRGRKRTPESIRTQLAKIDQTIDDADPVKKLQLIQDRMDLETELEKIENKPDLTALENDFVDAAKPYSERKGISYAAWRELGVEAAVLKRAGITRGM
ncbi:MAG: hypothetical protein U5K30_06170 [Acidimicrobiales bacterium]|nr:hypothetical protein [Acidimicrobiales bacterium]